MGSLAPLLAASPALASRVSLGSTWAAEAAVRDRAKSLPLDLWGVDALLPDGGLPRGAVVEVTAPGGLARATSLALAACASAQAAARLRGGEATAGAWCAWVDATDSLFAPAAARAGVDLAKLLVVRPPADVLARVAVRVAASRVFSVVVIDIAGVPGALSPQARESRDRWGTAVRRLALSVEGSDTAVVLLTDSRVRRSMPLPVAMRLELERPTGQRLQLRVGKERHGRVASPHSIALPQTA